MRLAWGPLVAATSLLAFCPEASAEWATNIGGAELMEECRKPDNAFCRGYVQAYSEAIFTRGTEVCIDPDTVTRDEMTRAVAGWIARYPGNPDTLVVFKGFVEIYPCIEQ